MLLLLQLQFAAKLVDDFVVFSAAVADVVVAVVFVFTVDEVGFGLVWFHLVLMVSQPAAVCYFEILVEWLVCGEHACGWTHSQPCPLAPNTECPPTK